NHDQFVLENGFERRTAPKVLEKDCYLDFPRSEAYAPVRGRYKTRSPRRYEIRPFVNLKRSLCILQSRGGGLSRASGCAGRYSRESRATSSGFRILKRGIGTPDQFQSIGSTRDWYIPRR